MLIDLTIAQCGSVSAPFLSEGDQLSQVATSGIPSKSWIVITSPERTKSSVRGESPHGPTQEKSP
ncbi:hypothetical protein AA0118_g2446 [Alternaria tenuissima]|nr:hypothetical protein AA0118_g2446 [Alternaria tenuissima]